MHTIALHMTGATVLAVRHLSYLRPSAVARTAAHSAGAMGLTFIVLVVGFLAMMGVAARGVGRLMSEFMRVAASMTSVLFTMLTLVLVAAALLVHH